MSAKYGGEIMEGMSRFLSRRGKRSAGEKRKSLNNIEERPPPPVPSDLYNIFYVEDDKKQEKDREEEKKKVKAITQRLAAYGINTLKEPQITYALRSRITNGDLKESLELLVIFEDSVDGILREYNPNTKLLGAENRCAVTCYLDSLLFAMFARLDSFEAMLFDTFNDAPRRRLATILRLWVNLLRAGKLITVDVTKHLQEALAQCGWEDAAQLCQQDASEAFTFITGQLELPLLTLKMDIYHTGKEDVADDHRFVNERLLEVAIPEDNPHSDEPIKLEECLEIYFNNRIEVRRHLERRNTLQSLKENDESGQGNSEKSNVVHVETVEVASGSESPAAPTYSSASSLPISPDRPINTRHRTDSIFSERHCEEGEPSDSKTLARPGRARAASLAKKEITMPAWQFFSLIPWYTDNAPANDAQVAAHFAAKRPILGICLKRYSMLPNGQPVRRGTYIDIPLEIALPHFISDDRMKEEGPLFGNFQLVLQSVVCHRGASVDSGHYISLVRGQAPNAVGSRDRPENYRPDNDDEHTPWMRFDDLARERVTYVDIHQALKEETPYLLFYQVCPIDEELARGDPPTYEEANSEATTGEDTILAEKGELAIDTSDWEPSRPSLELVENQVLSTSQEIPGSNDSARGRSSFNSTRRNSIAFDENSLASRNPTGPSTPADESKTSFLSSRRGSKATKKSGSKSRPTSQSGEGRLSITMSRLTGRKSRDKLSETLPLGGSDNGDGNAPGGDVDGDPANPLVLVEAPTNTAATPQKSATVAFGRSKKEKKIRRSSSVPLADELAEGGAKGKAKKKPPDRECVVM
ncbi:Peptidase C19 ubiquitin carboxyl-terminal hydrolase 2 [Macrophomina phaseolina MS6]|uniref:ubiquitinyl hydrolase 1 n=1 Tax=Macrophomina phaseolina (strain MS6) TaxID=1126212 RepID=K2RMW7_MACPH|nr:Peptidase C19 ubiquitin carboxyl-terminal hydrolase 2 [Macrophomina phaseolina MS6]